MSRRSRARRFGRRLEAALRVQSLLPAAKSCWQKTVVACARELAFHAEALCAEVRAVLPQELHERSHRADGDRDVYDELPERHVSPLSEVRNCGASASHKSVRRLGRPMWVMRRI